MFEDLVGGEAMVLYVNDVVGTWEDKSNVLWSVILKFYNVCVKKCICCGKEMEIWFVSVFPGPRHAGSGF